MSLVGQSPLEDLFQVLRPFIWPKYREEGPPEFVQGVLLGREFLGDQSDLNVPAKSVLELMTVGYRPVSTLAILRVLNDSPGVALHGMQIARELERRFKVQEGWFTRTRYYTDRVGRLLTLLTRLDIIEEVVRKDARGGRSFTAYQTHPSSSGRVKERLDCLARGEPVSLFQAPSASTAKSTPSLRMKNPRECVDCQTLVSSVSAKYCERCGRPLKAKCENCGRKVEATYDYCLSCGAKMT